MYVDFKISEPKKIRGLKSSNPKEYWRILNSDSKQKPKVAPLNELYEYFKNVNGVEINDTVPNIDIEDNSTNEEINSLVTVDEIIQAVNILKNNKSPGNDDLLSEHLKSSLDLMVPYISLLI